MEVPLRVRMMPPSLKLCRQRLIFSAKHRRRPAPRASFALTPPHLQQFVVISWLKCQSEVRIRLATKIDLGIPWFNPVNGIFTGVAARYLQLQHCPRWDARNKAVWDVQNLKQLKALERFINLTIPISTGTSKSQPQYRISLFIVFFWLDWRLYKSLCKQWPAPNVGTMLTSTPTMIPSGGRIQSPLLRTVTAISLCDILSMARMNLNIRNDNMNNMIN